LLPVTPAEHAFLHKTGLKVLDVAEGDHRRNRERSRRITSKREPGRASLRKREPGPRIKLEITVRAPRPSDAAALNPVRVELAMDRALPAAKFPSNAGDRSAVLDVLPAQPCAIIQLGISERKRGRGTSAL
jgi:hypothetical protein